MEPALAAVLQAHAPTAGNAAAPDAAVAPAGTAAGSDGDARVDAALAASTRTEASLSTLMRAVQSLSAGVSGAREANVQLVRELEILRDMLGTSNEQQLSLKNRVVALERALEQGHDERTRERQFLTEQHDAFISSLIEDHERIVAELSSKLDDARRRAAERTASALARTEPGSSSREADGALKEQLDGARGDIEKMVSERDRSRETLLRLQAQRDEAQAAVVRVTRERDQARAELAQLKIQQGMSDAMREALSPSRSVPPAAGSKPSSSPTASTRPLTQSLSSLPKAPASSSPNQRTAANAPTAAPPPRASAISSAPPPRATSSPPISSPAGGSPSSSIPPAPTVGGVRVTAPMSFTSSSRPTAPPFDLKPVPRKATPPEELRAALTQPVVAGEPSSAVGSSPFNAPPSSPVSSDSPALRPKPDPSSRPLIGYSMTEAVEERVDTSRITSPTRPPER